MTRRSAMMDPVFALEQEAPAIRLLERVLEPVTPKARLVTPQGEEIPIPETVYQIMRQVIHHLAAGQAVHLVPLHRELSTQEAAELLNVSRPFLSKLLDQGEIPFVQVGSHRRVRVADMTEYMERRAGQRRSALRELTQLSQDEGFYDGEATGK